MTFNSEEVTSELTTILDYIRFATSQFNQADLFFGHGTQSAHDEAVALVLHTLNQPYDLSKEYLSAVLTVRERQTVVEKMQQRITTRKPLAYLTHEAIFAGLSFYVDERVLVPRSPIAELIEQQFMPWVEAEQVDRILDLCTGSGCIALACAHAFPEAQVDAVELSPDALAVATMNIERHGLQDRVVAIESDLFLAVDQRYDLIVSNPPYVNQEELRGL
ncbi:MAG: 50S ribosomal protein L3 N(5)-glutamine methyltransferase, partial [Methylococcales bacterium]|nr:50S ribosomal protein L3 N(5)-glutamine methyltransferase [Methylococcales bacterium]